MAAPRSRYTLRRIDCVNTLISRPGASQEEILLVWNADWRPPGWSLPGGARECSESLSEAATREVREETGLEVEVSALLEVHEKIGLGGRIHLVVFTFVGSVIGGSLLSAGQGEPEPGGVSSAQWFPRDEARLIPVVARVLDLPGAQVSGASCTHERFAKEHAQPASVRPAPSGAPAA